MPLGLLAIIWTCGTLERHLEVHMSDLSVNNDAWLSKLRSHLDTESYTGGTVSQYMGVARRFVADLNKRRVAITATREIRIESTRGSSRSRGAGEVATRANARFTY